MSKDTQKTYSAQTASFLAKVGECMPHLDSDEMQAWIQNPKLLKRMLGHALSAPCYNSSYVRVDEKNKKLKNQYAGDLEKVGASVEGIQCKGSNPFELHGLKVELRFCLEYNDYEDHTEVVFRPWLSIFNDDLMDDVDFCAEHFFRGFKKLGLVPDAERMLFLNCNHRTSLSEFMYDTEIEYANALAAHLNKHYTTRLSVEEKGGEWLIHFFLLKGGASAFSTEFRFPKNAISQGIEKKAQREREQAAAKREQAAAN